jgi:hypothetical protein
MLRCREVHSSIARDIATNFATQQSAVDDPLVRAAYAELCSQTDHIYVALTVGRVRRSYRVVFTEIVMPYSSDEEMIEAVRLSHVLEVTTAAVARDRGHPLMDCTPGGEYDRFRAVHDLVGHVATGLGFDRHAEYTAWLLQHRLHRGLARWALATELHGENSLLWTTGELAEHKAILLDPKLLRRSRRAARPLRTGA